MASSVEINRKCVTTLWFHSSYSDSSNNNNHHETTMYVKFYVTLCKLCDGKYSNHHYDAIKFSACVSEMRQFEYGLSFRQ